MPAAQRLWHLIWCYLTATLTAVALAHAQSVTAPPAYAPDETRVTAERMIASHEPALRLDVPNPLYLAEPAGSQMLLFSVDGTWTGEVVSGRWVELPVTSGGAGYWGFWITWWCGDDMHTPAVIRLGRTFLELTYVGPPCEPWHVAGDGTATVRYDPAFASDAHWAVGVIDLARAAASAKYGTDGLGKPVTVVLHSTPSPLADSNTATLLSNDVEGVVHYLTPSAAGWASRSFQSLRARGGTPLDHHQQTLTHELMTLAHEVTRADRRIEEPDWFVQGLQEFDGFFYSTAFNRDAGADMVLERALAADNLGLMRTLTGRARLAVGDPYVDGFVLMWFIADLVGEDSHAALLRHQAPTLEAALVQVTGRSIAELFDELERWVHSNERSRYGPAP